MKIKIYKINYAIEILTNANFNASFFSLHFTSTFKLRSYLPDIYFVDILDSVIPVIILMTLKFKSCFIGNIYVIGWIIKSIPNSHILI